MMLCCQSLSYAVSDRILFSNLSINFPPKKIIGIIGTNGSGKSTLLLLLAGIKKTQKGQVLLHSFCAPKKTTNIEKLSLKERAQHIAYLPQKNLISADMTALEVVLLGRAPYQNFAYLWSKEDYEIAKEALHAVSLSHCADRWMRSLSGGEFQRVMLARLLASQTEILLLDEAITALDIHHSLEFMELCLRLCENQKTIILVIHQLEIAFRYCNYAVLLGTQKNEIESSLHGPTKKVMQAKNLENFFHVKTVENKGMLHFFHL